MAEAGRPRKRTKTQRCQRRKQAKRAAQTALDVCGAAGADLSDSDAEEQAGQGSELAAELKGTWCGPADYLRRQRTRGSRATGGGKGVCRQQAMPWERTAARGSEQVSLMVLAQPLPLQELQPGSQQPVRLAYGQHSDLLRMTVVCSSEETVSEQDVMSLEF